ncbi:aspartyl/asparaginyl beta-hydroxylase domain-containing protein [Marinihelvus fidelis]|uniref:Aspartyl/asparaginyl beta-hydroxylase domain-containing protein n=1 Tax=Marinihelvus fidelis TaxID=2613842 RepID=A0A5N0T9G3_9GAMM|nr:aspartyl/asparaginyl beta-hydroxylase domain-containing protein [Marinihelvus fidelis]KAA9131665.1 aspartyl/asparaginyl beta-hydroxylase domain-containing protein [Marinihelvus fidelis]
MNIGDRLRDLGDIDIGPLRAAILAQEPAAWLEQEHRQKVFDVHRLTQSIVMVFINLEPWPAIELHKEPGWDRLADVAIPVMHDIIARHYPPGGTIIRAMAAKLLAGGRIPPHSDTHPSFHVGHRIHVPITTNPRVRFMIDGRPHRLQPGRAYEINNQLNHSVANKGADDRITFIFDYLPPEHRPSRSPAPAARPAPGSSAQRR